MLPAGSGFIATLSVRAREIDRSGRIHVASATRYFSYYLIFSVNHPVSRVTNSS